MKLTAISKLPGLRGKSAVFDTEGTGLQVMEDEPVCMSLEVGGKAYVAHWSPPLIRWLNKWLPEAREVICHGAKFDMHMCIQGGCDPSLMDKVLWQCTAVRASLINEFEHSFSLDALTEKYDLYRKTGDRLYRAIAGQMGGDATAKAQMKNLATFYTLTNKNKETVASYAADDVRATRALFEWQEHEVKKQELERVVELEMAALPVLTRMERRGVEVNQRQLDLSSKIIGKLIEEKEAEIVEHAGFAVNVRSGPQMVRAFENLGLEPKLNEKGNPTFAKEVLEAIDHDFCRAVMAMRSYRQVRDAFIDGFDQYIGPDGKVHTQFNQLRGDEYGTGTGRLSSSKPNMQQSPKRNREMAALCRSIFCAPKGHVFVSADWSQFEYRIFAHYTKEPAVLEVYREKPDTDFHQMVSDLTGLRRDPEAKQVNLGLVFGMGEGKLAQQLKLPYTSHWDPKSKKERLTPGPQAKAIFDQYHSNFPGARVFLKKASALARSRGYIRSIMGRRMRFPNKNATYKAGGYVFQSSAADILKKKLPLLDAIAAEHHGLLLLTVHDEFNFTFPKGKAKKAMKAIKACMEDIPELDLPVLADMGVGPNWWEACKGEDK